MTKRKWTTEKMAFEDSSGACGVDRGLGKAGCEEKVCDPNCAALLYRPDSRAESLASLVARMAADGDEAPALCHGFAPLGPCADPK